MIDCENNNRPNHSYEDAPQVKARDTLRTNEMKEKSADDGSYDPK